MKYFYNTYVLIAGKMFISVSSSAKQKHVLNILYLKLIICMSDRMAAVCVHDLKYFVVFDLETFLVGIPIYTIFGKS